MPLVDKSYGTSEAFLLLLHHPYITSFYHAETMRKYVSFFIIHDNCAFVHYSNAFQPSFRRVPLPRTKHLRLLPDTENINIQLVLSQFKFINIS